MQISKLKLIEAIDAATKRAQEAQQQYDAALETFTARRNAEWRNKVLPCWKELADLIRVKVRAKQPIAEDEVAAIFKSIDGMFGNTRYGRTVVYHTDYTSTHFTVNGVNYNGRPVVNPKLAALRKMLEAIEDDTVTPSALKGLGFDKLEWLFSRAVA